MITTTTTQRSMDWPPPRLPLPAYASSTSAIPNIPLQFTSITRILVAVTWDDIFSRGTLCACWHVPQGLNMNVTVDTKRGRQQRCITFSSSCGRFAVDGGIASTKNNANCIQSKSILCTIGELYAFHSFPVSSTPTTCNNRASMLSPYFLSLVGAVSWFRKLENVPSPSWKQNEGQKILLSEKYLTTKIWK